MWSAGPGPCGLAAYNSAALPPRHAKCTKYVGMHTLTHTHTHTHTHSHNIPAAISHTYFRGPIAHTSPYAGPLKFEKFVYFVAAVLLAGQDNEDRTHTHSALKMVVRGTFYCARLMLF